MTFVEFMIAKAVVIVVLAFCYGVYTGYTEN